MTTIRTTYKVDHPFRVSSRWSCIRHNGMCLRCLGEERCPTPIPNPGAPLVPGGRGRTQRDPRADRSRRAGHGDAAVSGLGALVVGLVLCFVGVKWLPVAVLASGFALGWLITEPFNASLGVAFVIALAAAVAAWVLATFVCRAALFFVGLIAGGVIGAKLFGLLQATTTTFCSA